MFEKLLSQLPYNPGLSHQLAFYARRMREEATIRRTGLVFIALAFMVQFIAVLSPPQSTTAASNNDLINGGFSSAAEAARYCQNNTAGYGTILGNYGITCTEVANSPVVTVHSTDSNRKLYSMGRLPYGLAGETPVTIGGKTYYFRYLWSWDTHGASTYSALRIIARATGKTYYLLYTCGNLVSVGLPQAYSPPGATFTPVIPSVPRLSLTKTTIAGYPAAGSTVAPGTTLGYRVNVNNTGNGTAHTVTLIDTIPSNTTFVSQSLNAGASVHSFDTSTRTAKWVWATVPPETGNYSVDLKVTISAATPNGTQICNMARVDSPDTPASNSNQVCVTV
ncbi:MAG TPA: hypothetical protein VN778_04245, partial [Verrucomicrobiae bacterium]|nr:hypothetical protein [Verrucomicrobiae bacterium]